MSQILNYKELAQRYGLEPVPESVVRLTQLVARQDADLDEIASVISRDAGLSARILRAANPNISKPEDYDITTVEDALMRSGVGCVLLLAMATPLTLALIKTFQTMLHVKLENVDRKSVETFPGEHILGTIKFSGRAEGEVFFRLSTQGAKFVAAQILGIPGEELGEAEIKDAVGELLNITTGNFKSNLCDAGLDCRLTPPAVRRSGDFSVHTVPGGGVERMAFKSPNVLLFVDVSVNPWRYAD
jgi:CheY-specific phosphatase CheX